MKISLTTKIFLAFGLALAAFAVLALVSVKEFRDMGEDLRSIHGGHLALARIVGQLETLQQNRFRDLRRGLSEPDPGSREVVLRIASAYFPEVVRSRVEAVRAVCHGQLARRSRGGDADATTKSDFYRGILAGIARVGAHHESVDDLTDALLARVRQAAPVADLKSRVDSEEAKLRAELFQLNRGIDDETDRAVRRAEREERHSLWRVIVMTAAALLLGIVLTLLSARALAPIQKLVAFARAISRGDYEQKLEMHGEDELSALAEELTAMARARKEREGELDRKQGELERAYHRVADLKRYHESVVQSLKTAVIVTDRALDVTGTNRAASTVFGLAHEEVLGQPLAELPIGAELGQRLGPLARLLEEAETASAAALTLDDRQLDVSIAPLENEAGAVLGLVVAIEDVTEAVQTKEALIRSERLAAIGRMSAHVTHEIRNPLSSIGLNAEQLLESLSDPPRAACDDDAEEAQTLCRAITREVDRLAAITDEYLRFARLPRPELHPADPAGLLVSIAEFVRRDCAAANVELSVDVPEQVPPVDIDADQMRQAILNLVRNAKESMPHGGRIELSVDVGEREMALIVKDTGVGIDADDIERIFDPFYSTKLTGTGLGLALVQQIVTEHGGALQVTRREIGGTEFRICMPRHQDAGITAVSAEESSAPRQARG